MIYAVSDLHGSFDKFKKLLREIKFNDNDVMYVIGDIVDYGEESMDLLCDLSMRYNVIPIVGDHDFCALKLLRDDIGDMGSLSSLRTQFINEARAFASLSHHGVVRLLDASLERAPYYFVMEYVESITFKQYLNKKKRREISRR